MLELKNLDFDFQRSISSHCCCQRASSQEANVGREPDLQMSNMLLPLSPDGRLQEPRDIPAPVRKTPCENRQHEDAVNDQSLSISLRGRSSCFTRVGSALGTGSPGGAGPPGEAGRGLSQREATLLNELRPRETETSLRHPGPQLPPKHYDREQKGRIEATCIFKSPTLL